MIALLKKRIVKIAVSLGVCAALLFSIICCLIVAYLLAGSDEEKYDLGILAENLPPPLTEEMVIAAIKSYETYGVPAALTLAQIILESSGSYEGGLSQLAFECNNLFGIKGEGPAGSREYVTGEQTKDGKPYKVTAKFRVYGSFEESIMDHGKLLSSARYKVHTAKAQSTDDWARAIAAAGYATDTAYADKLISIMSGNDLYRFDGVRLDALSYVPGDGISSGKFLWPLPVRGRISSPFGPRGGEFHRGVDIAVPQGTAIFASDGGTVTFTGYYGTAGYSVFIDHGNGYETRYYHIMQGGIMVSKGQKVSKGQQIARSGNTGRSTGPHLHFGMLRGGNYVDPLSFVKQP